MTHSHAPRESCALDDMSVGDSVSPAPPPPAPRLRRDATLGLLAICAVLASVLALAPESSTCSGGSLRSKQRVARTVSASTFVDAFDAALLAQAQAQVTTLVPYPSECARLLPALQSKFVEALSAAMVPHYLIMHVLRGAESVLRENRAVFIVFEYNSKWKVGADTLHNSVAWLRGFSYFCWLMTSSHLIPLTGDWWDPAYEMWTWSNIVCALEHSVDSALLLGYFNERLVHPFGCA